MRSLVRGRNAVAMITLPPSFMKNQDEDAIKRLSWAVDASLEIKGFAGECPPCSHKTLADVQTIQLYNPYSTLSTVSSHSILSPTPTSFLLLSSTPLSSAYHRVEAEVRIISDSAPEGRGGESRLSTWVSMVEWEKGVRNRLQRSGGYLLLPPLPRIRKGWRKLQAVDKEIMRMGER